MICWDEARYRSLYSIHFDNRWISYSREFVQRVMNPQTDEMDWIQLRVQKLGAIEYPAVIVGCGFGFLGEFLDGEVIGIDCSPFIHANKATEAKIEILDAQVGRDHISRTFSTVIDDDAVSSHADDELQAFYAGLEALGPKVVHLVSCLEDVPGDSSLNWKTLEEWRSTAPEHTWLDLRR